MPAIAATVVKLRDYQERGVADIRSEFDQGHDRVLYVAPTGSGKTTVFSYIASNGAALGWNVDIWVHRQELIKQVSERLCLFGVPHGIVAPKQPRTLDLVQVCSVYTLARPKRRSIHRVPDLIVVDEAHHATAATWKETLNYFESAQVLGVTATPIRADGSGLDEVYQSMVLGPSVRELTEQGWLVPARVFLPPNNIDRSKLSFERGEYVKADALLEVNKPSITGNAVEHYQKICPGVPSVAFCISVEHAQEVAATFNAAGITAASIDGSMDDFQRRSILQAFAGGAIKILTSCDLISEGFDCPEIGCCILLRPTCSTGLHLQAIGRALRPAPGKTCAFILDAVGNTAFHGFPDDERHWSLVSAKRKRKDAEEEIKDIITCHNCFAAFAEAKCCPQCGTVVLRAPARSEGGGNGREIDQVEGELIEAKREALLKKQEQKRELGRSRTLKALLEAAENQGKQWRHAYHIFNARRKKQGYRLVPIPDRKPDLATFEEPRWTPDQKLA